MKVKGQHSQDLRRNSQKSDSSITPIRVPFKQDCEQLTVADRNNAGFRKNRSYQLQSFQDCILTEFKSLCKAVLKKLECPQSLEDIIYSVSKSLHTFERILSKKMDSQMQEILALKIIHQEDTFNIQKLNKKVEDLQEKLNKLSFSLTQTPLQVSPKHQENMKSVNCSIELITKKPYRNTSYSFQEQHRNVFTLEDKENENGELKRILKPKQFKL